jgi:hypothetical protein
MMDEIIESLTATITHPLELMLEKETNPTISPDKPLPSPEDINEVRTVRIGGFCFKIGSWQHLLRSTGSVVYSYVYTHFIGVLDHLEINTIPILIAGIEYESMSVPGYKGFSNSQRNPQVKKLFENEDRRLT